MSVFTQNKVTTATVSSVSLSSSSSSPSTEKILNSNNRIRKTFGRLCVFNPLKQLHLIQCNVKNKSSKENISVVRSNDVTTTSNTSSHPADYECRNNQKAITDAHVNLNETQMQDEQKLVDKHVLIGSHKKFVKSTSVDYYV